ncbi:expressed protein [Phakopsora pachyrhizi]|uniref:Expressed protein n=1 Tax=Phakopsora pachyrhizi TaxID=170000 RepID=A0AAV0BLD5_PHAPC|nr:expressed protein [Phakopsora pachyrhizi]
MRFWIITLALVSIFFFIFKRHNHRKSQILLRQFKDHHLIDEDDHEERFLSYLPHSGFHNQRIALENGLTLSKVLNRTLLLPRCLIGAPVPFIKFDKLKSRLRFVNSRGLEHCEGNAIGLVSRECLEVGNQNWLDWSELIDLTSISKSVRLIKRTSFEDKQIHKLLNITQPKTQVYQLKDVNKYQYRFLIGSQTDISSQIHLNLQKFQGWIDVQKFMDIKLKKIKLIELGSLFGSGRLKILKHSDEDFRLIRTRFRKLMVFKSPQILSISNFIAQAILQSFDSKKFYGVHVRVGDHLFRQESEEKVNQLIRSLVEEHLKLPFNTLKLALQIDEDDEEKALKPPKEKFHSVYNSKNSTTLKCRAPLHTKPELEKYNVPLYIATDAPSPLIEPSIIVLTKAFPCSFF